MFNIFLVQVVMVTDGETGHQQIVITDGRIVSGPRVGWALGSLSANPNPHGLSLWDIYAHR